MPIAANLPNSVTSAIERGYAAHVATRVRGQILRYSDRLDLLRAAERLGINRFRANLIIATVQHEQRGERQTVQAKPAPVRERKPAGSFLLPATVAVAMEIVLLAGAWIWISG